MELICRTSRIAFSKNNISGALQHFLLGMNSLRKFSANLKNKFFTGCDPAVKSTSFGNAYL